MSTLKEGLRRAFALAPLIPTIAGCASTPASSATKPPETPTVIPTTVPTETSAPTTTVSPTETGVPTAEATETSEPSKFNIEFPGGNLQELSNEKKQEIINIVKNRYECHSPSCDMEVSTDNDHTTLVLKSGEILDKDTNTEYTQPVTLIKFYGDIVPAKFKAALLKTEGSDTINLYAMNADGDMEFTGVILHTDGEYYKLILTVDSQGNTVNALKSDLGVVHYLTVDPNNTSTLIVKFTINEGTVDEGEVLVRVPNPGAEGSETILTTEEAQARALNPLEQIKVEYDVDSANFESSTFFANYQAWQITENNITDRQTGEQFGIGDYIIFTEDGPIAVHVDFDLDEVVEPGIGYAKEWEVDRQNNLKLTAVFLGDPDVPSQVWNSETRAWEEKANEHEVVFEAMMNGTKEMWNGGTEVPGLSLHAVESNWEKFINFTLPDQLVLPEGFDPDADRKVVKEFILNNFGTIVAIDPITGEIVEVQALNDDGQLQVDIVVISDIGEGIPYYWDLSENDVLDRVYLPGYMQYNELTNQNGKAFAICFFPATETQKAKIVLYIVGNYHKYDDRDERQRMGGFAYSMFSPLALFGVSPEKMRERVLDVPEGARKNNHTLGLSLIRTLGTALQDITKTTEVWKY